MAAPQQVQTVDAVRCYRDLQPTLMAPEAVTPGIVLGTVRQRRARTERPEALPLLPRTLRFGQALAQLLEQGGAAETRAALARGAVRHLGQPRLSGRCRPTRHLGGRPARHRQPAVRAARGGAAAGVARSRPGRRCRSLGLFHSVFLPVSKLIEIGTLIAAKEDPQEDPTADPLEKEPRPCSDRPSPISPASPATSATSARGRVRRQGRPGAGKGREGRCPGEPAGQSHRVRLETPATCG